MNNSQDWIEMLVLESVMEKVWRLLGEMMWRLDDDSKVHRATREEPFLSHYFVLQLLVKKKPKKI